VAKIVPLEGGGYWLMNNISNRTARCVVVSTGASSRELLEPLGVKVRWRRARLSRDDASPI